MSKSPKFPFYANARHSNGGSERKRARTIEEAEAIANTFTGYTAADGSFVSITRRHIQNTKSESVKELEI